jgi:hypothetical protein
MRGLCQKSDCTFLMLINIVMINPDLPIAQNVSGLNVLADSFRLASPRRFTAFAI